MYELSSIAGYVCTQEKHFLEGSARYSVPRICCGFWTVSSLNKEEGCFFNFLSFYYFILSIYLSVCVGGCAFMPLCTHGGQRATLETSSFRLL